MQQVRGEFLNLRKQASDFGFTVELDENLIG
jgi:hypothetical protein